MRKGRVITLLVMRCAISGSKMVLNEKGPGRHPISVTLHRRSVKWARVFALYSTSVMGKKASRGKWKVVTLSDYSDPKNVRECCMKEVNSWLFSSRPYACQLYSSILQKYCVRHMFHDTRLRTWNNTVPSVGRAVSRSVCSVCIEVMYGNFLNSTHIHTAWLKTFKTTCLWQTSDTEEKLAASQKKGRISSVPT